MPAPPKITQSHGKRACHGAIVVIEEERPPTAPPSVSRTIRSLPSVRHEIAATVHRPNTAQTKIATTAVKARLERMRCRRWKPMSGTCDILCRTSHTGGNAGLCRCLQHRSHRGGKYAECTTITARAPANDLHGRRGIPDDGFAGIRPRSNPSVIAVSSAARDRERTSSADPAAEICTSFAQTAVKIDQRRRGGFDRPAGATFTDSGRSSSR